MTEAEPQPCGPITIEVVDARTVLQVWRLQFDAAPTLLDALQAAGIDAGDGTLAVGVFGRRRSMDARLEDGDRVELYAPLRADPKTARRTRARRRSAPG